MKTEGAMPTTVLTFRRMSPWALAILAALAFPSCRGHERPVGIQPTPLSVKDSAAQQQAQATPERENMRVQGPHADAPGSDELAKNGKPCSGDRDCAGRLRCVSFTGVAGREMRQCAFSCLEACPAGWICQPRVADGPSNTCAHAR
jgi:hypothetical protein